MANSSYGPARILGLGLLCSLIVACASQPENSDSPSARVELPRVYPDKDGAPLKQLDPSSIVDATPRYEPLLPVGNVTPYKVLGQEYALVEDHRGFRQRGTASWYGTKFHGKQTSNGEIYDLYAMTAAHKTLPIPVYVKVTNLNNGKQAIVRVNDRGPFHSDRIIDLSYAAAVKLGYAEQGTAPVEIEVIDTDNTRQLAVDAPTYYLQVAAFQQLDSAERLESSLSAGMAYPVQVASAPDTQPAVYRVRIGPLRDFPSVQAARKDLSRFWSGQPSLLVEGDEGN